MGKDKSDKTPAATHATTATRATNEWGIPDWRDASAYGEVNRWTFNRWRWEFYRRREELRDAFVKVAENDKAFFGEKDFRYTDRPAKGTLGHFLYVDRSRAVQEYLGYLFRLPDPSVSNHPEDLLRSPSVGFLTDFVTPLTWESTLDIMGEYFRELNEEDKACLEKNFRKTSPMLCGEERAVISFDLTRPIADLVREAKTILSNIQRMQGINVTPSKRRHPTKWLAYLRTLDAREAGASWAEITENLYAQGVLDRRKNPSGGYCAPPPQAARDMWEAANTLRFNF